jgi:hypothetical protein
VAQFLIDESLPRIVATALAEAGHDALDAPVAHRQDVRRQQRHAGRELRRVGRVAIEAGRGVATASRSTYGRPGAARLSRQQALQPAASSPSPPSRLGDCTRREGDK